MARTLVVGSYPPIPLPSAAVSVAAVRAAWAAGDKVTVVSPRPSAAHLMVPITGPFAGHRLDHARKLSSATRVVLVVEPGFPVAARPAWIQKATVVGLVRALGRFEHSEVKMIGPTGLPAALERALLDAADRSETVAAGPGPAGVTPLGPVEIRKRDVPAKLARGVAYRVLGQRAAVLTRAAAAVSYRLRRALERP
jgi:hypothetical protein